MNEIAKARAEKAGDSRLWSAEDCLEDLLQEIRAGRVKAEQLCVHYMEAMPDGGYTHHYSVSGMTSQQHIAMLAVAQHRAIEDWMR